jgi:hypothetical protein
VRHRAADRARRRLLGRRGAAAAGAAAAPAGNAPPWGLAQRPWGPFCMRSYWGVLGSRGWVCGRTAWRCYRSLDDTCQ